MLYKINKKITSVYVSIAAWLIKISNWSCIKLALSNFYFWHFWKKEMENKKLAVLWAVGAVFWLQWTWPLDLCHRAASYSSPVDGAGSWGSAWWTWGYNRRPSSSPAPCKYTHRLNTTHWTNRNTDCQCINQLQAIIFK